MRTGLGRRLDERRVKYLLGLFFAVLAVPAGVLIFEAYSQLKWEAFRRAQLAAEDLAARVDAELRAAVAAEDARAFGDYSFLVVKGDAQAGRVQRSPLSAFPVRSAMPGALGYFEVDPDGALTTPLLPEAGVDVADYGISPAERSARLGLEAAVRRVLVENRLVPRAAARADAAVQATAGPPAAPGRAQDLERAEPFAERALRARAAAAAGVVAPAPAAARRNRTEQTFVPEVREPAAAKKSAAGAGFRIRAFESELGPFEIGLLDSGQLLMYRNVWRDGRRYIQGAVIDSGRFVESAVAAAFEASSLAAVSHLVVAYGGKALGRLGARGSSGSSVAQTARQSALAGSLLYRERMSPPFGGLELVFSADRLPLSAGGALLAWVAVVLAALLGGGFFFMYRFAVEQIRLSRQQQDFVSAVSHELKTPLTSIRMYGEMLRAGWVDEARKATYYEYIHGESERLSRLIENVLQLARLTRRAPRLERKPVAVAELLDAVRSKVATQVERAGFALVVRNDCAEGAEVTVDADSFAQIVINLVDNAVKFSAAAERKVVELGCRPERDARVLFTVRDFGPGIQRGQMKRIFELFYRPPDELTRGTSGTGIGLALVRQLTAAMGGRVEVRNCSPGAEFRVSFPQRAPRPEPTTRRPA